MTCHPERKGPQTLFSLGVVSRRICGCTSGTGHWDLVEIGPYWRRDADHRHSYFCPRWTITEARNGHEEPRRIGPCCNSAGTYILSVEAAHFPARHRGGISATKRLYYWGSAGLGYGPREIGDSGSRLICVLRAGTDFRISGLARQAGRRRCRMGSIPG